MRDSLGRMVPPAAALATVLLLAGDVRAHKLRIFAAAEGQFIRGEAYMSGGGRPRNVEVIVRAPGGRELGRIRTDGKGAFEFAPAIRCDHTFIIDTGDGHRAEYTLQANELPKSLPAGAAAAATTSQPAPRPSTATSPAIEQAADQTTNALPEAIARVVRRELAASEERVRLRDIIGGIGYIVGVMGLLMMWKCRRRADSK